jgi:hypothetical protein
MSTQATVHKIRRSFTITPESAAFLRQERQERKVSSDSEALDLLLRDLMEQELLKASTLAEIDAAFKEYYDTASDAQLAEEREWADMVGPNVFAGLEP